VHHAVKQLRHPPRKGKMGKRLTPDEWKDITPPFAWMKLKVMIDDIQLSFIDKWLTARTSGWWYRGEKDSNQVLMVFEHVEDMVMFKLWASDNTFEEDGGEIQ
jgi:hypothetical protein